MDGFVKKTQIAVVQGRQILDGALITCESIHWQKKKKKRSHDHENRLP